MATTTTSSNKKKSRLGAVVRTFSIAELRGKILFTLFIIVIYRLGAHIPVPGTDFEVLRELDSDAARNSGTVQFINLFSGGALTRFSLFALGILPYITASIIIQLLGVVIPKLDEWRKEGASGQKKLTQTTRYVALILATIQAAGLAFTINRDNGQSLGFPPLSAQIFPQWNVGIVLLVVGTLVAGTALVMWMGELIGVRGIGQGMSLIVFANVVAGMPGQGASIYADAGPLWFALIIAALVGIVALLICMEQGQRRIPVQFAKRMIGRKQTAGGNTYIPLKVNMAGVVPVIFASSVLYLPTILQSIVQNDAFQKFIDQNFNDPTAPLRILVEGMLILGFAYFFNAIQFDPNQQAEIIRQQGGYIPGVRPGPQTERYLTKVMNRITLPGALVIAFIAVAIPVMLKWVGVQGNYFAGTTMLIAVGVALETMKQINSQLTMRNYEGFLRQ